MKIAIYGRPFNRQYFDSVNELFNKLNNYDIKVVIFKPFYNYLVEELKFTPSVDDFFTNYHDINRNIDYMLSIGGDGTFLEAASIIRHYEIPIAGINLGKLGFLANISKNEISDSVDSLVNNKFILEPRALIKMESSNNLFDDFNYALNEVTIHKTDTSSMVTIHAYLNDEFLNSYWADGLIVATPTGSTAYSLSVGGPIVTPDSRNFIIAPIAPHNLTVRPIVVPDNNIITLKVDSSSVNYLASLDFRSKVFDSSVEIKLKLAEFSINTIRFNNQSFFSTLRTKFMWGVDKRN
jgi:NAD+ kinase